MIKLANKNSNKSLITLPRLCTYKTQDQNNHIRCCYSFLPARVHRTHHHFDKWVEKHRNLIANVCCLRGIYRYVSAVAEVDSLMHMRARPRRVLVRYSIVSLMEKRVDVLSSFISEQEEWLDDWLAALGWRKESLRAQVGAVVVFNSCICALKM